MKAIASLAFAITSTVGICVGAGALASYVMAEPSDPRHGSSATDLWTTAPVKVEPGQRSLERLPPLLSSYALEQPKTRLASSAAPQLAADATPIAAEPVAMSDGPSPDHQAWCRDHYRSYDAASDSYRSFSGQSRPCVSPYPAASTVSAPAAAPQALSQDHIAWCSQRYQSYRAEDNSYQPFGGSRKTCASPFMAEATTASAEPSTKLEGEWASR